MEAVDRAVLERLAGDLGGAQAVVEIVHGYLDLMSIRLDALDDPLTAGRDDLETVSSGQSAAHTLRSGAELLGARSLAGAAELVEHGRGSSEHVRVEARAAARDWRRWLAREIALRGHAAPRGPGRDQGIGAS